MITPVFETEPDHLRACLRSVADQTYRDWEHILVDDGSTNPELGAALARAAARDPRVKVIRHERNAGIVAASNTALAAARGEFVTMLDHDDVLVRAALERMVGVLRDRPTAAFAYSDNAVLRRDGRVVEPFYKPDFSPERLRNHNYVLHSVMAPLETVRRVGGFRAGFDGAQDHDLLLRLSELGPVLHVAEVLYHWREAPASVATDRGSKPYAYDAGVRAVQAHCDRVGVAATVEHGTSDGTYRVRRSAPDGRTVSVILPTRGTVSTVWGADRVHVHEAMRSIRERSSFTDLEFVVVADDATPADVLAEARRLGGDTTKIVMYGAEFNFSAKVNLGAREASGDLLLFLNDDTELIDPGSIGEMAAMLAEPGVGMVGAKLLYADGTIQHAGHVYPGLATHAFLATARRPAARDRACGGSCVGPVADGHPRPAGCPPAAAGQRTTRRTGAPEDARRRGRLESRPPPSRSPGHAPSARRVRGRLRSRAGERGGRPVGRR